MQDPAAYTVVCLGSFDVLAVAASVGIRSTLATGAGISSPLSSFFFDASLHNEVVLSFIVPTNFVSVKFLHLIFQFSAFSVTCQR